MNILIVEDEPIAVTRLCDLIASVAPGVKVCGKTRSISETLHWLQTNATPDLVMMDINLADGTCFSLFEVFDITAPIIFCTAYDEFALKAFQANGIAYLLKPILEADLKAAFEKLETLRGSLLKDVGAERRVLKGMSSMENGYKLRFLVKAGDKLLPVPVQDIACFMAQDQGVKLYLKNGGSFFIDYAVAELEKILNPDQFFRISRQAIIAGDSVVSATAGTRQMRVVLSCLPQELSQELSVARERTKAFRSWLGG